MDKEHYYTTKTDRERLSSSQRQLMSLQSKYDTLLLKEREHLNTITDLTSKSLRLQVLNKELTDVSFEDDGRIVPEYKQREQTPMYMLNTLEECYTSIRNHSLGSKLLLATELRNVIKFLQQ